MKKRLIIYFNYHPNGQADAACRFAVQQIHFSVQVRIGNMSIDYLLGFG